AYRALAPADGLFTGRRRRRPERDDRSVLQAVEPLRQAAFVVARGGAQAGGAGDQAAGVPPSDRVRGRPVEAGGGRLDRVEGRGPRPDDVARVPDLTPEELAPRGGEDDAVDPAPSGNGIREAGLRRGRAGREERLEDSVQAGLACLVSTKIVRGEGRTGPV